MPKSRLLNSSLALSAPTLILSESCPAASVSMARRMVETPLLDQPRRAPSTCVAPPTTNCPTSWRIWRASSRSSSPGKSIRTSTFATVPDAPVTKFVLSMQGGKRSSGQQLQSLGGHPAGQGSDGRPERGHFQYDEEAADLLWRKRFETPKARLRTRTGGARRWRPGRAERHAAKHLDTWRGSEVEPDPHRSGERDCALHARRSLLLPRRRPSTRTNTPGSLTALDRAKANSNPPSPGSTTGRLGRI